ncbi:hypothetical protein [Demequina sp.]|uniref:hypothetical protein n=1 Tax=Demequina sp. TaxID=2050685 RepID=UPI003A85AE1F
MDWFYDPERSYEDNYANGPFGAFAGPAPALRMPAVSHEFLGVEVASPFGIPAGPLVNARFCAAAFAHGFDVNVYKTVRSRAVPCHPHPNVLNVDAPVPLTLERARQPLVASAHYEGARSISNSFGVPSQDPAVWQPDMAAAAAAAGPGQFLIGSFQGTRGGGEEAYIADHVTTARLAADTGVRALELNLSCPNEGTGNLLCFDTPMVTRIVRVVRDEIGDLPLILKLAFFQDWGALTQLVQATHLLVDGYAAINTIAAPLVDSEGHPALPGEGREVSGVCGEAISWAGFEMVDRLVRIRALLGGEFAIVGVGGVMDAGDASEMLAVGADAVMSATGSMIDPALGAAVRAA